jgi:hypothetical protein
MATITIPRHIEHRNGFNIQFQIRQNFNGTDHWLYFEVLQNGKLVYSDSDQSDNESLKRVYLFTDSEIYRNELNKKEQWRNTVALLSARAVRGIL